MRADEITNILNNYSESPYNCIFFDGPWGIGKTYAIEQAMTEDKIVRVTLNGVKKTEDIYSEILDSLVGKAGLSDVVKKVSKALIDAASIIDQTKLPANLVSNLASSFLSYKETLRIYFNKQEATKIVVLDDFERTCDGIDNVEIFRVVEFLTGIKNVKVALVGDLSKLNINFKEKFSKFSERYIDKIYKITNIPSNINWQDKLLNIDSEFIKNFKLLHDFNNLRTIIKANNFFIDVKNNILNNSKLINSDQRFIEFWNELRLACFAVVIEDIDKLELTEVDDNQNDLEGTFEKLSNQLEYRVMSYLRGTKVGIELSKLLIDYYNNNEFDVAAIESIFKLSTEKELPIYFYSDEETIKKEQNRVLELISNSNNIDEILKTTGVYTSFCYECKINYQDIIEPLINRLRELINNSIINDDFSFLDIPYVEYIKTKTDLYKEVEKELTSGKKELIKVIIDRLMKNDFSQHELELAKCLNNYSLNDEFISYINEFVPKIMCDKAFPLNAKNDIQYYTCVELMKLLYKISSEELTNYYNMIMSERYDPIAKYRCKNAMYYVENCPLIKTTS